MPLSSSTKATPALLHDLLKLTGDSKTHWCPVDHSRAGEIESACPELWKALRHHCVFRYYQHKDKTEFDREAICISIADQKASAISRRLRKIYASRNVYKVWRDERTKYGEPQSVPGVIEYVIENPDLDVIFDKYRDAFSTRPETIAQRDGSSFTSLLTHAELTDIWAKFFLKNADYYGIPERESNVWQVLRRKDENGLNFLEKRVLLIRCKIRTHGRMARLRDLEIIKEVEDRKDALAKAIEGEVLYSLQDELLLIARPDILPDIKERLKNALIVDDNPDTNHFIEFVGVETIMAGSRKSGKGFLHNFDELFGGYPSVAYSELEEEIKPDHSIEASSHAIICDLCQMAPAEVRFQDRYKDDSDTISEYLCKSCNNLRDRSTTRARKLANWELAFENTTDELTPNKDRPRVCMVKVSLDMKLLIDALTAGFENKFKDKLLPGQLKDQDLGFSIISEFLLDYEEFLQKFEQELFSMDDGCYSDDNSDRIMDGFFAIRIDDDTELVKIIEKYMSLYDAYFPRLKNDIAPIRLAVSCSRIKHPFLEHWDVLDNPADAIDVQSVNRARLSVSFEQLEVLEKIRQGAKKSGGSRSHVSTFLHNLADIEARTRSIRMVQFAILEKHEKEKIVAAPIMQGKASIGQVLSYYKLFMQGADL